MSNRAAKPDHQTVLLDVDGMKCGACVQAVENILLEQTSVINASVNLVARTAWVNLNGLDQPIDHILEALAARGFSARIRESDLLQKSASLESDWEWWRQWRQLMVAMVLLLLSVLGHLAEGGRIEVPIIGALPFHAGIATLALLGPGRKILVNGARAAVGFTPTMDTLVGLGVTSAYLASLVALIWPQVGWPCFFNEPVMLLGFILLGRFLEERARFRTGRAIKQLAELQPDKARLLLANDLIREVRIGALRPGERVQLLAGDLIPVDGVVIDGSSAVDVSSLTGEPLPIQALPGIELSAGSLNLEATLIMEVTHIGADTALARIIALVEQAQARKAPIQGLADRIAGRFCYGVLALAFTTFFFWWLVGARLWPEVLHSSSEGLLHPHGHALHTSLGVGAETPIGLALQLSIAVLVIACPCALGLATPTVITVASGQAAKKGWLFRGGDVLEKAASIQQMVFDKTGTLTIGRPLVSDVFGTQNAHRMLQLAASLEQNSRHPLAYAILQEAQLREITLLPSKATRTFSGKGIEGEIADLEGTVMVGTPEWLISKGINLESDYYSDVHKAILKGKSLVAVAHNSNLLGFIAIEDRLRPDVGIALDRLRKAGLKLAILSGDRQEAVESLGKELGFTSAQLGWRLLPSEKLDRLAALRMDGFIAMVGDGINDAPVLAAADLGIAVGTGTQIAQESSDLVLLGDRLESIPEALLLARRTMRKVRENLVWAFGYNLIALPIAAGVLLPGFGLLLSPPIAALLMAVSSITVVLNALLLRTA